MNNVNTTGIQNAANQIQSVVNSANNLVNSLERSCIDIVAAKSVLEGYNGSIVANTQRRYYTTENYNGTEIKVPHDVANFWKTSTFDVSDVTTLNDCALEVNSIVTSLNSEAIGMDRVAEAIDGYINSVESSIINGTGKIGTSVALSSEVLSDAFKAIGQESVSKANLAKSGEDINSGNYLDYSEIQNSGLANKRLSFVLQNDGSYRIYTSEGETEYYTTALAAAFYQKTLKTLVNNNSSNNSNTSTDNGYTRSMANKIDGSSTKDDGYTRSMANQSNNSSSDSSTSTNVQFSDNMVSVEDLDDSTKKEIWEYCYSQNFDKTESEKSKIYNNLSDLAKKIVDREIIVFSPIDGSTYSLSNLTNIEIK